MDDMDFDILSAIRRNRERLEQRFAAAVATGAQWLVECRDLGDAFDADAGVYFVECADEMAVDAIVARCTDDNPYERLLGIFDVRKPLDEQGGGMSRAAWITNQSKRQIATGPSNEEPFGTAQVVFDASKITYILPNGATHTIAWTELQKIEIVTTNTGPFIEDVFWVLHGDGRLLVIPQTVEGWDALLVRFQALPGFDNDRVITAMSCTDNQRFVCWTSPRG